MRPNLVLLVALPMAAQNLFQGSVSSGEATATPLMLSLDDAIARGLKNNLGVLAGENQGRSARLERSRALNALLPLVTGGISETSKQINLATYGFHFSGFPTVSGPFGLEVV